MTPLRLAVDTNVILDWAAEMDDVLDALSLIQQRLPDSSHIIPPTVLDELAYLEEESSEIETRHLAQKGLQKIIADPIFIPVLDLPLTNILAAPIAIEIRSRKLLPPTEVNDSLILAETAILDCSVLLTSDNHLRSIDHLHLTWLLNRYDLKTPVIATPLEIVRKFL